MNDVDSRSLVRVGRAMAPWLLGLALVLVPVISARAQVVFDAASNTPTATVSTANPVAVSWNHTVGLAKKPYIIVSVSLDLQGGGATSAASLTAVRREDRPRP